MRPGNLALLFPDAGCVPKVRCQTLPSPVKSGPYRSQIQSERSAEDRPVPAFIPSKDRENDQLDAEYGTALVAPGRAKRTSLDPGQRRLFRSAMSRSRLVRACRTATPRLR